MSSLNHFTVGILSPVAEIRGMVAKAWGKKGSATDIALYSISKPLVQTTVTPETYPNKVLSMVVTAHMSDIVVVGAGVGGVDAHVGEVAILADTLELPGVLAVIGESVAGYEGVMEQMRKVFSKLVVSSYPSLLVDRNSLGVLRDKVLEELESSELRRGGEGDPLVVEVDHAFPVQGVGSVILGTVVSGVIQKGMKVRVLPGGHVGTVKSIQVNDVDEREAGPGTHVGVALRGILDKNLSRGSVLTTVDTEVEETDALSLRVKVAAFGGGVKEGMQVHVVCGLADSPGEIVVWEEQGEREVAAEIKLGKPVPLSRFTRVTVLDMNGKQRIVGSRKL